MDGLNMGNKDRSKDVNDALIKISAAEAILGAMGRNDSEFPFLKGLKERLVNGKISSQGALEELSKLMEGKQEY